MSVKTKSLIGSRSGEKKVTSQSENTRTAGIGKAKSITATALRRKTVRGAMFRAAKKKA